MVEANPKDKPADDSGSCPSEHSELSHDEEYPDGFYIGSYVEDPEA